MPSISMVRWRLPAVLTNTPPPHPLRQARRWASPSLGRQLRLFCLTVGAWGDLSCPQLATRGLRISTQFDLKSTTCLQSACRFKSQCQREGTHSTVNPRIVSQRCSHSEFQRCSGTGRCRTTATHSDLNFCASLLLPPGIQQVSRLPFCLTTGCQQAEAKQWCHPCQPAVLVGQNGGAPVKIAKPTCDAQDNIIRTAVSQLSGHAQTTSRRDAFSFALHNFLSAATDRSNTFRNRFLDGGSKNRLVNARRNLGVSPVSNLIAHVSAGGVVGKKNVQNQDPPFSMYPVIKRQEHLRRRHTCTITHTNLKSSLCACGVKQEMSISLELRKKGNQKEHRKGKQKEPELVTKTEGHRQKHKRSHRQDTHKHRHMET